MLHESRTVSVAISGGVDSAVAAALAVIAKKPENVVGLWRGINSDPKHREDAIELARVLGIDLFVLDVTDEFDSILKKMKAEAVRLGRPWVDESSSRAKESGFQNAYASMRSRFTTPLIGFLSKAMDNGGGRIIGTGNAEEDGLLRYYDKFGDGAVDCNPLNGLLKVEVRQLAIHLAARFSEGEILKKIAHKLPSPDLHSTGDAHNDESEFSEWAKNMGFPNAKITYGDCEKEGTIAWVIRQEQKLQVISKDISLAELVTRYRYKQWEAETIRFIIEVEKNTRHKDLGLPGIPRDVLIEEGYVI